MCCVPLPKRTWSLAEACRGLLPFSVLACPLAAAALGLQKSEQNQRKKQNKQKMTGKVPKSNIMSRGSFDV
jgi:hypothetical protein